jgi:hypothetical protein
MRFLKEVQRATLKTNQYINDNNGSLLDLLLLLVTPVIALDTFRQLFNSGGLFWTGLTLAYIGFFALIPTLWMRSTVENKDPERDFISYLGSPRTYLTALILILIPIAYSYIPTIAALLNTLMMQVFAYSSEYLTSLLYVLFTALILRFSFIIPLYNSGLALSSAQAFSAMRGKILILVATIINAALPLIIFSLIYGVFIMPWMVGQFFADINPKMITMILIAPVKYLAVPLIMIYGFTALAYHYANYAKQYLVMSKAEPPKADDKTEIH